MKFDKNKKKMMQKPNGGDFIQTPNKTSNQKKNDVDRLMSKIRKNDIEFIRLQFIDIFGVLKSVNITPDELPDAIDGNLMFDGSSIDGFAQINESDQCLMPDPDTFQGDALATDRKRRSPHDLRCA